ncbi:MAG: hypothetical protein WCK65_07025 [Rhodospirillaceae bacterium]
MSRIFFVVVSLMLAAPVAAFAADPVLHIFTTEADATAGCGKDAVVWLNKSTKVYHSKGSRWFGKTKDGAYGCQAEMEKAGNHGAKLELPAAKDKK